MHNLNSRFLVLHTHMQVTCPSVKISFKFFYIYFTCKLTSISTFHFICSPYIPVCAFISLVTITFPFMLSLFFSILYFPLFYLSDLPLSVVCTPQLNISDLPHSFMHLSTLASIMSSLTTLFLTSVSPTLRGVTASWGKKSDHLNIFMNWTSSVPKVLKNIPRQNFLSKLTKLLKISLLCTLHLFVNHLLRLSTRFFEVQLFKLSYKTQNLWDLQ